MNKEPKIKAYNRSVPLIDEKIANELVNDTFYSDEAETTKIKKIFKLLAKM